MGVKDLTIIEQIVSKAHQYLSNLYLVTNSLKVSFGPRVLGDRLILDIGAIPNLYIYIITDISLCFHSHVFLSGIEYLHQCKDPQLVFGVYVLVKIIAAYKINNLEINI